MKKLVGIIILLFGLLCVSGALGDPVWPWPLADSSLTITSHHGNDNYNSKTGRYDRKHTGIDISVSVGTELYSPFDGTAIYYQCVRTDTEEEALISYGNKIIIVGLDDSTRITFGHLDGFVFPDGFSPEGLVTASQALSVSSVDSSDTRPIHSVEVHCGDLIGYTGNTGNSTGPHLHFEVSFDNNPADPQEWFDKGTSAAEFYNSNHLPEGDVQHFSYHDGAIHIQGWAVDRDTMDQKVHVHMYVGGPASPDRANVLGPDYIADKKLEENVGSYSFQTQVPMSITENTVAYIYFLDTSGTGFTEWGPYEIIVNPPDTTNIMGAVQEVYGTEGGIHIRGWAVDQDTWDQKVNIHMYVGSKAGTGPNVLGPNFYADTELESNVGEYSFETTVPVDKSGETFVYIYFLDTAGNGYKEMGPYYINIPKNQAPTIKNVTITNITKEHYTVQATVTDNVGVTKMQMPTWYQDNSDGKPDATWYDASHSGTLYSYTVNRVSGKNEYHTDLYAWDAAQHETQYNGTAHVFNRTLTLEANDGTGYKQTKDVIHARVQNNGGSANYYSTYGTLPTLSRSNYTFEGWYTSITGGDLVTSESYVIDENNHTLYAHWKEIVPPVVSDFTLSNVTTTSATFTVTATDNVGVDHVITKVWSGDFSANMSNSTIYEATQTGDAWSVTAPLELSDGDSWYIQDEVYDAAGNVTQSGVGGLKQFTLSFDPGEGSCDEASRTMIYTSLSQGNERSYLTYYDNLPIANRSGYSLDGWYTEDGEHIIQQSEATEEVPATLVTNKEDHTLYAHWILIDDEIPVITDGVLSNITDSSATITVTATDNIEVERVTVEVYNNIYKDDNPTTFEARKDGNVWVCDFSYDFSQISIQMFYVDAYDSAGNKSYSTSIESDINGGFIRNTITYDPDGGTCNTASDKRTGLYLHKRILNESGYLLPVGDLPEVSKEDYTFDGWYKNDGTKITPDYLNDFSYVITLYAHWIPLPTLELPGSLVTIEENAFEGVGAAIIHVPSGCTTIKAQAFLNCKNLQKIYIPDTVKNVDLTAFDGCPNLTVVAPKGNVAIRVAKYNDIDYVEQEMPEE